MIFDSYAHNMAVYPNTDLSSIYERIVTYPGELLMHHGEPFTMLKTSYTQTM